MENYKTLEQINSICQDLLKVMSDVFKNNNTDEWLKLKDAYDIVSDIEDIYLDKIAKND